MHYVIGSVVCVFVGMSASVASANDGLKRFNRKRGGVCLLFACSEEFVPFMSVMHV
jgi:hypothetical protein